MKILKTNVLGQKKKQTNKKKNRIRVLTLETCKPIGNNITGIDEHLRLHTMASGEEN